VRSSFTENSPGFVGKMQVLSCLSLEFPLRLADQDSTVLRS
jgi:hypothetical protein